MSKIDKQQIVFITYVNSLREAERIKEFIEVVNNNVTIKIEPMPPIIRAHIGQGSIIISHIGIDE